MSWKWVPVETDSTTVEEIMADDNGEVIAKITKPGTNRWYGTFYKDQAYTYKVIDGSVERARWEMTNYIYNACDKAVSEFCYIRDHLPDRLELLKGRYK